MNFTLHIKGRELHSLAELQDHFDLNDVMDAFLDGTLEQWLAICYYDWEARAIGDLEAVRTPWTEREVCRILGTDWLRDGLSPDQRAVYERKRAILEKHTRDENILVHALDAATNQAELAELLSSGLRTIYLCEGPFRIPIRKSGVSYIGVDSPTVETEYTAEQYWCAGITFTGVDLPLSQNRVLREVPPPEAESFARTHSPLTAALHFALQTRRFNITCPFDPDLNELTEDSYSSAEQARRVGCDAVNRLYDVASAMLVPGTPESVSTQLAHLYGERMTRIAGPLAARLTALLQGSEEARQPLQDLQTLTGEARSHLQERFDEELRTGEREYSLPERSGWLRMIQAVNIQDEEGTARLPRPLDILPFRLPGIYMIEGLERAAGEIYDTLVIHTDRFCTEALQIYRSSCAELEQAVEAVSALLPPETISSLIAHLPSSTPAA